MATNASERRYALLRVALRKRCEQRFAIGSVAYDQPCFACHSEWRGSGGACRRRHLQPHERNVHCEHSQRGKRFGADRVPFGHAMGGENQRRK